MERLTVPDVRVDEHTTRRSIIDGKAVREHAMEIYWRLKEELHTIKNELCQYCGKYKQAHEGACDGCRWREM